MRNEANALNMRVISFDGSMLMRYQANRLKQRKNCEYFKRRLFLFFVLLVRSLMMGWY